MRTLEERIALINKKVETDREKEKEATRVLEIKTDEALQKVKSLESRIKSLLALENKCQEVGMELPKSEVTAKFGYGNGYHSYDFYADGILHHVGFMVRWEGGKRRCSHYLGIKNGGCCGVWDFYTNGEETFLKHQSDGSVKLAELKHLNSFLKEFDVFEESFYKWLDSVLVQEESENG